MAQIYYTHLDTPIGKIRLKTNNKGLVGVDHTNQQEVLDENWLQKKNHPILQQAITELNEYFAKKRKTFDTPLNPQGTQFQQQVWQALRDIPYGETTSYSAIAEAIKNPKSIRAVGLANGKNPLSIFIPCHRVIGKSGKLTGYGRRSGSKTYITQY